MRKDDRAGKLAESSNMTAEETRDNADKTSDNTGFNVSKGIKDIRFPKIFMSRIFISVLILKIVFSFLFGSDVYVKGTIPFVNYFISSGFQNPYNHFLELGQLKAFPYSTTMLLFITIPVYLLYFILSFGDVSAFIGTSVGTLNLFVTRVPLLIADIGIFYILSLMLKTREKETLLFYWCSPITFYIIYFHGQLDVIPVFLLFVALYLLLNERELASFAVLGLALSAKANIFVALPFILLYLWRKKYDLAKIAGYTALSLGVYAVMVSPFLFSEGYKQLVLNAEEQYWLFTLMIPYTIHNLVVYVVPLVLVVFFFRIAYFKTISQDSLFMSLAVGFTILVTLVPPMPGWFYWSIPFIAYFFVKEEGTSKKYYTLISVFYFLYFVALSKDSDIFKAFQVVSPQIAGVNQPYYWLASMTDKADFIVNTAFTILIAILLSNIYFIYKRGLLTNLEFKDKPVSIGIAGDSATGKSTLNSIVIDMVGSKNTTVLEGDDLHKWERSDKSWEKLTHLDPKGNYLYLGMEHLEHIKTNKPVHRKEYDHSIGKFRESRRKLPSKFVIVSGLHSFYISGMRKLLDVKIFLQPEEELRRYWKTVRDSKERGYNQKKIISQIRTRMVDSKKYIMPQKRFADVVISFLPAGKIWKNKGRDNNAAPKLLLNIIMKNFYDVNHILSLLEKDKAVKKFEYSPDLETISMQFSDTITAKEVENIAYAICPNLEEMLDNRKQKWHAGHNGIIQLFILLVLMETITKTRIRQETD